MRVSDVEGPSLRVSYLVLAHSDPGQLGRLGRRLARPGVRIYIHLDKKVEIAPFEAAMRGVPDVVFCQNRVRVMWGAFSVVTATLNLIEAALAGGDSDYLVLISGADYPLAAHGEIMAYLAAHKGRDLARLSVIPESETEVLWRVRGWHFRELANRWTLRRKFLKPIEIALRVLPRKVQPGVRIAVGSQWWALTEETARFTLGALKEDRFWRKLFRFSLAPDEIAFHTVLANSPYNDGGRLEEPYQDIRPTGGPFYLSNFHYIDRDLIKGVEKAERIMAPGRGFLFGRKFKSGDSDTALDVIDAILDAREAAARDAPKSMVYSPGAGG